MSQAHLIDENDLARARADLAFRRRLLAANLRRLLSGLQQLRCADDMPEAERERQIREGMALAVKLADLLRATAADADEELHAA
jgi:hypothetical protein